MARSLGDFLPLKTDVIHILLALRSEPRHGYSIITDVDRRSAGSIRLQTGALLLPHDGH